MDKIIYNVLDKIEKAGFKAYIVGGYVRSYFLKRKTFDIDIATSARPMQLKEIFKETKIDLLEYGNVLFSNLNYKFDITTFRKEIGYKKTRKPDKIEYTNTLEEDIIRRDFTINTICMDKDENIIDILNGKDDINKKIIKSVGDPDKKMSEDSLRMLRAIRFATILNFKIDKNLENAIINNKHLLKNLSFERKKDELTKIFIDKNKKYGIELIKKFGLLEALDIENINKTLLTNDSIGIWFSIDKNLKYPYTKNEKNLIKKLKVLINKDLSDPCILYEYGVYLISVASDLKRLNKKKMINKYERLPIKDKSDININADQICEIINRNPGPFIKDIYIDLEYKIITKKIKNNYKRIKEYLLNEYCK